MSLHTWNKADWRHGVFDTCRAALADGDALLLFEDGVYVLLREDCMAALAGTSATVLALDADLAARGISAKIPAAVTVIDYTEFVRLSLQHDRVINWT